MGGPPFETFRTHSGYAGGLATRKRVGSGIVGDMRTAGEGRPRALVPALGAWAGWMAVLELGRAGLLSFRPGPATAGLYNACVAMGYPKAQDYVRYGLACAAGPAGAWLAVAIHRRLAAGRRRRGHQGWWLEAGLACAAAATVLACASFPSLVAASAVAAVAAIFLPWRDRRWWEPARPAADPPAAPVPGIRHVAVAAGLAAVWVFDSCLLRRPIDGVHEGAKLLYVQSFLAGDTPGAGTAIEYGPLYVHSVWWWMRGFGLTVAAFRWHFLAAQAGGLAIQLLVLRALAASPLAVVTGACLLLSLTSVSGVQYGVPNALRVALPMAALALGWRGLTARRAGWLAASGAGTAVAWLFSPEYGVAAAAGLAVMVFDDRRRRGTWPGRGAAGAWLAGAAATAAGLLLVMFGRAVAASATALVGGGYGMSRLLGQGAWPLPAVPWWVSLRDLWFDRVNLLELGTIWGPGLLASGAAAWWLIRPPTAPWRRGSLVAGWVVFTGLGVLPAVVRPLGQQENAVAAAAVLAAVVLDALRGRAAVVAAGAALAVGAVALAPHAEDFTAKPFACLGDLAGMRTDSGWPRLGGVRIPAEEAGLLRGAVDLVRRSCPPGGRVYVAATAWAHVPFLADRAGLRGFPSGVLAARPADRRRLLEELDRERPAVALVADRGFDVPFATERPEEAAYVAAHYRLAGRFGDLGVYVRGR